METRHKFAAISLSMLIAIGAGCDQEAIVEEGGKPPGIVGELATDSPVEPVSGAAPGFGDADLAQRGEYSAWDANADGVIDESEFRARFNDGGWYGDWDGDGDGVVSDQELDAAADAWRSAPAGVDTDGLADTWDSDEDGLIDNKEAALGTFSTWDRDNNNLVDANEFSEGVRWFGR